MRDDWDGSAQYKEQLEAKQIHKQESVMVVGRGGARKKITWTILGATALMELMIAAGNEVPQLKLVACGLADKAKDPVVDIVEGDVDNQSYVLQYVKEL
ncbi:hypothetical protein MKW98_000658 [Papaver atlanticum]|uniref:Uncharacterized protein n=1 Tax=Papaver atlanticum TaxID=357466 RepID=A0AAD4T4E5_9MAGN|nr:hypothetical protein MKW98_000658 [Papaver atlanticum]